MVCVFSKQTIQGWNGTGGAPSNTNTLEWITQLFWTGANQYLDMVTNTMTLKTI